MKTALKVAIFLMAGTIATPSFANGAYFPKPSEMRFEHEAWPDGDVIMSWYKSASVGWYSYDIRYSEISPREFAAAGKEPDAKPEKFDPSITSAFSLKSTGEVRWTLTEPKRPPIVSRDGDLYLEVAGRHFKLDEPLAWDNDQPVGSGYLEDDRAVIIAEFARHIAAGDAPKVHVDYVPTKWEELRGWWNGKQRCLGYWWDGVHVDVDWCRVN